MAHNKTIQAIRIVCDTLMTEHTELGLYSADLTVSEIRWSENILTGTTLAYVSGIIAPNGISAIKEAADWQQTGGPVQYDGLEVLVVDTNQLFLRLKELGVKFTGLKCEVHEFVGTETNSDAIEDKILFTGTIENPVWTETILQLPVKNNNYKRRALMATVINNSAVGNYPLAADSKNGQCTPMTFGKFYPSVDWSLNHLAKFVRTSETDTVLSNDSGGDNYYDPRGANIFPIIGTDGTSPYLTYKVQFGTTLHGSHTLSRYVGKYMQVVVGGSSDNMSFVGKYRKISAANLNGLDTLSAKLTIESFFEKDLSGNSDATATNNAWIQISDIPFEYTADVWPCFGFIDESGNAITSPDYPRLAVYDSSLNRNAEQQEDVFDTEGAVVGRTSPAKRQDGFIYIPHYGYEIDSGTGKNKFKIDLKLFKDSPEKMSTFSIFPCENITRYVAENLDKYGISSVTPIIADSNCYTADADAGDDLEETETGTTALSIDRDDSTEYKNVTKYIKPDIGNYSWWQAFEFELPKSSLIIDYDKFFIGIKSKFDFEGSEAARIISFKAVRFVGSSFGCSDSLNTLLSTKLDGITTIDDLPDFYYVIRSIADNNKAFYFQIDTSPSELANITGVNLFECGNLTTKEIINSIQKCCLLWYSSGPHLIEDGDDYAGTRTFELHELALICEKQISIQENIFAMFSGRVFNNTWGSRKTATALIEDPIDMIEHANRLQNWQEVGNQKVYGKEYCPNALIRLDANDGSFHSDNTLLDTVRALRPRFQIFDAALAWTDNFKKFMCEQYFLCTRQDSAGYECVHYLDPQATDETDPAVTVTFADVNGDVGATEEPKSQNVFCEPFINYAYNNGSQKYDKQLRILNSADAAWVGTGTEESPQYAADSGWHAEYTPGFSGTDGQAIWEDCHALWNRFRILVTPPSNLTDSRTTILYLNAVKKMQDWVAWMGKRRSSFTVAYNFTSGSIQARDWHVAQKIKFSHPHKTNGWAIKCLIEKIEKDKHAGIVKVNIILLEEIASAFFLT